MSFEAYLQKVRSLESFGVAGLLSTSAVIYYDQLYSTKALGRVSDLLVARIGAGQEEELKLRVVLLYAAMNCCQHQKSDRPLLIEMGSDDQAIAIGVSLLVDADFAVEAWAEHFKLIMHGAASGVVIRFEPKTRRLEFAGVILRAELGEIPESQLPAQVVTLGENAESVSADQYVQLADTNYAELMREQPIGKGVRQSPTGSFLVNEAETVFKGNNEKEKLESRVVKGKSIFEKLVKTVIGGDEKEAEIEGDDRVVFKADGEQNAADEQLAKKLKLAEKTITELQEKLARSQLESTKKPWVVSKFQEIFGGEEGEDVESEQEDSAVAKPTSKKKKKAAGVAEAADHEGDGAESGELEEGLEDEDVDSAEAESAAEAVVASIKGGEATTADNAARVADKLVQEIEKNSSEDALLRFKKQSKEIMDVLESPEAKQWVSDMKDEMTKEWNRLAQMGRDVQKAVKDKDLEIKRQEESFKKQAQAYLQDIQSKDKAIRHRDMTISRMKETIANANLEKAKLQSAGATTQGNKKGGNDSVHIQQLNARLSHSQKQFDDLKRQHKALQDKVAAAQKTQTTTETPAMMDLKKKLEASTKMAEHHKKQMERLNSQVELARKDEARYKGDINRLQTEVATLKAQAKAPAGSKGGAGGGANAA